MMATRSARRALLALVVVAALVLLAIALTVQRPPPPRPSSAGDAPVVVQAAPEPRLEPAPPLRDPATRQGVQPTAAATSYGPMLQALGMPADARLYDVAEMDPVAHVTCGEIASPSAGNPRRFVYIGLAGLGAIDDGGEEFARMRNRLCQHR